MISSGSIYSTQAPNSYIHGNMP